MVQGCMLSNQGLSTSSLVLSQILLNLHCPAPPQEARSKKKNRVDKMTKTAEICFFFFFLIGRRKRLFIVDATNNSEEWKSRFVYRALCNSDGFLNVSSGLLKTSCTHLLVVSSILRAILSSTFIFEIVIVKPQLFSTKISSLAEFLYSTNCANKCVHYSFKSLYESLYCNSIALDT